MERRLDRLTTIWPDPALVLAEALTLEIRSGPRTFAHSQRIYRRCRALIAEAGLSPEATARALTTALIAFGSPVDGARAVVADTPLPIVLGIASLGARQLGEMGEKPEAEWRDLVLRHLSDLGVFEELTA